MKNELIGALKLNKDKEVRINYEELKNHLGFEDIFYDDYLVPMLKEVGATHRFSDKYIILKFEDK